MMEWKKVKLGEITTVLGDGIHGTPSYDEQGDYFFINGNNLSSGHIDIKDDTKRVSYAEFLKYKKPLCDRSILVSINGTIGNVAKYNGEKCILGKSACYFNVNDLTDRDFIYYVILSPDFLSTIINEATGTTIKNVSLKQMRNYTFNIPTRVSDQRRIAAILSSLDAQIENNNRINHNLEAQAQALFKSWFVDFAPWGGVMPEGWKEGNINDLAEKLASGGTPKSMNSSYYEGDIRWYSTKELKDGFLIDSEKHISQEAYNNSATKMFPKETILMAIYAAPTVGRLGILTNDACFNQAAVGILPKKEIGYPFVYSLLLSERINLNNLACGAAQQNLNVGLVKNYTIIIPDLDIIKKYNTMAMPIFAQIRNNTEANLRLASLRDTLLPKLMKGEIEV